MGDLPVKRALGVHWNTENNYLGFKSQLRINHSLGEECSPPLVQSKHHLY